MSNQNARQNWKVFCLIEVRSMAPSLAMQKRPAYLQHIISLSWVLSHILISGKELNI